MSALQRSDICRQIANEFPFRLLRRTPQRALRVLRKRWLRYHMKRQGDRCHYCSEALVRGHVWLHPSLDHVVPLSKGGDDHLENTVAACKRCNRKKADMSYEEFRALAPSPTGSSQQER